MLRYLLTLLIIASSLSLYGRIVNGYAPKRAARQELLTALQYRLRYDETLSAVERHAVKAEIKELIDYLAWYELTEVVLDQLRKISPGIYHTGTFIKDKKGRPTDIYVKIIPRQKAKVQLTAASFVHQRPYDADLCISEYGECTASIEIWISDNALYQLSHELGHVTYIIPNLARYSVYYKEAYSQTSRLSYMGHRRSDLSGQQAEAFEKEFFRDRKRYIEEKDEKPMSPFALINPLRRSMRDSAAHDVQFVKRINVLPHRPVADWKK